MSALIVERTNHLYECYSRTYAPANKPPSSVILEQTPARNPLLAMTNWQTWQDDVKQIMDAINEIRQGTQATRDDINELRQETAAMRDLVEELRLETRAMRNDIDAVREEIRNATQSSAAASSTAVVPLWQSSPGLGLHLFVSSFVRVCSF